MYNYGDNFIINLVEAFCRQLDRNVDEKEVKQIFFDKKAIINEIMIIKKDIEKTKEEKMNMLQQKEQQVSEKESQMKYVLQKIALLQWNQFRNSLSKCFKDQIQREVCARTVSELTFQSYSIIRILAQIALTLPLTNASPQRGFSQMKLINRREQNKIHQQILQYLMNICINGPKKLCSEQIEKIFNDWTAISRRAVSTKDIYLLDDEYDDELNEEDDFEMNQFDQNFECIQSLKFD